MKLITILVTVITLNYCWGCDKLDGEWKFTHRNNRLSCIDYCFCKSSVDCVVGPHYKGCRDCCITIKEKMEETIKVERSLERKRIRIEQDMEATIKTERASELKRNIIVVVLTLVFLILVAVFVYYIKTRNYLCFRPTKSHQDFSKSTNRTTDIESRSSLIASSSPNDIVRAADICNENLCNPQEETNEGASVPSFLSLSQ